MDRLFELASEAVFVEGRDDRRDTATAYGKIAEFEAIAELLGRGHKVAVPVVDDDGVDLVVNYRFRVQVKNAFRRRVETLPGYSYEVLAWSSKRRWSEADVFLLRGDGRWWVVPAGVLDGHGGTLMLYDGAQRGRTGAVLAYEGRWGVFDGSQD